MEGLLTVEDDEHVDNEGEQDGMGETRGEVREDDVSVDSLTSAIGEST